MKTRLVSGRLFPVLRLVSAYFLTVVIPICIIAILPFILAMPHSGTEGYRQSLSPEYGFVPWARWDSFHYLSIARSGYSARSCGQFICGNTGWYPLFPWLIRVVAKTGLPLGFSSLIVTLSSLIISSEILSRLLQKRWSTVAVASAFICLPGGIYYIAAFPVSVSTACTLAAIWALVDFRLLSSAAFAFLASLSYPSSVIVSLAISPFLIKYKSLELWAKKPVLVLVVASPLLGFLAAREWIDRVVHIPSAYALTQARYGHSIGFGFEVLRSSVHYFWKNPIYFQTSVVFLLMIASSFIIFILATKQSRVLGLSFLLLGWSYWVIPHLIGDSVSVYRQESLISPMFVFAGSFLPKNAILLVLALLCPLSIVMTRLFLVGRLV